MRNELNRMVANVTDEEKKRVSCSWIFGVERLAKPIQCSQIFDAEMQSFFLLFNRFLTDRAKGEKM